MSELYFGNQRTSAIVGVLNSIQSTVQEVQRELDVKVGEIVCVWDYGHHPRRKAIHPDYKAHRRENQDEDDRIRYEEFINQTNILHDNLRMIGVKSLKIKGQEADDLISAYIHFAQQERKDEENHFIIVSTDQDYLQLVDSGVSVYSPIKKVMYTIENFEELVGITPEQHITLKILTGDSSDNIPGIHGIGEVKGKTLIKSYGTLANMLSHHEDLKKSKVTSRIFTPEGLATLDRNNRLMNLREYSFFDEIKSQVLETIFEQPYVKESEVSDFLKKYGVSSILIKLKSWLKLYKDVNLAYYES